MLWRSTPSSPVCLICGAAMALRRVSGHKVEVWQCAACGRAGASFYAIRPAARVASSCLFWLGKGAPRPAAAAPRPTIEAEFAQTEQAIKYCRRFGDAQRAEVERLERRGEDASDARGRLTTFRRIETEHAAHRERLMAEMASAPPRMTEPRE